MWCEHVCVCACHTIQWRCRGSAVLVEQPPLCPLTQAPGDRDYKANLTPDSTDRRVSCIAVYLELLFQRDAEGQRLEPEVSRAQENGLHRIPERVFISG